MCAKPHDNRYSEIMSPFRDKPARLDEGDLSCVSLFSGCLGLDLGLHFAGFGTKVCIDFDKDGEKVTKQNFSSLNYMCEDITQVSPEEILRLIDMSRGDIDLIAGGPPCQPFSKSGRRKGLDDERGNLFESYIEILDAIKPKAFVFENVRGIYSSNKGDDFRQVLKAFKETGYTVYWRILDSANYGVPQFRQRLFIVGFSQQIRYEFPLEEFGDIEENLLFPDPRSPFITVEEAIGDLAGKVKGQKYQGQYAHLLSDIPEGLNYSFYCAERGHPEPKFEWRSKFWYFLLKIDRSRPSLTIQAYPGNNTGPFHWENRKLDIREIARLQTFPDWYEFDIGYGAAHRLIGNAVPCLLGYVMGSSIRSALEKEDSISDSDLQSILLRSEALASCSSGRGSGKGKFIVDSNGNKCLSDG